LQTELLKSGVAADKLISAKNRESEIASGCDMLASRCKAINDRDSRFISKGLGRREGSTEHVDRYPEVGFSLPIGRLLLARFSVPMFTARPHALAQFLVAERS
jgi:hypothetical protein